MTIFDNSTLVARGLLLLLLSLSAGCSATRTEQDTSVSQEEAPSASPSQDAAALKAWAGTYEYSSSAGQTVGGTGAVTTYRLQISGEPSSACALSIEGFQVNRTLRCEPSGSEASLKVSFVSYGDGRAQNEFGVAEYQSGQVLFTLQRTTDGTATTMWEALVPDGVREKSGAYFRTAGRKVP